MATPVIISLALFLLLFTTSVHTSNALSLPSPEIKRTIQNLLSISTHLQNPDLYSPSWANSCNIVTTSKKTKSNKDDNFSVIASRRIEKGELITLYPVHAIGLKSHNDHNFDKKTIVGMGPIGGGNKKYMRKKSMKQQLKQNKERFLESYDYLFHDSKWDFDVTLPNMKIHQHEIQIPFVSSIDTSSPILGIHPTMSQYRTNLYIQSHPKRKLLPGWYGHLIPTKLSLSSGKSMDTHRGANNCILVPIPHSMPLCGIVATRSIEKGEQIIRKTNEVDRDKGNNSCIQKEEEEEEERDEALIQFITEVIKRYTGEISELGSYYNMAYANEQKENSDDKNDDKKLSSSSFHSINGSYPNLTRVHTDPDIYTIPNFLSPEECDRLIRKSSSHLKPCLIKSQESGSVQMDAEIRTSTNANIPRAEIPSITKKIKNLVNCKEEQLEIYQVLKYGKGQEFKPHTDGFDGPITACGFFQSGRIVTLFCYLNDVEEGGKTAFTKLGIDITPRKGTAVIHFPMTKDLEEDDRTEHEGSLAIDEKWILTTWIWKDDRLDERYAERHLPQLDDDII